MWCYVFIIPDFIYIQAFLHCLFTGNETNGCICLDIGVPGSLFRILAWTKFVTLAPQAIVAPGMHEDPFIFKPLSHI